jgi:glycosyltransferase involved in cell wall biosynthesis
MRRRRLVVVGPLPPPFGGVQRMIDMQLRSRIGDDFEVATVDTSRGQLRWAVESPTWRTPLYSLRDVGRLIAALVRIRPAVVLVHASSSPSFVRDWALMVASRLAGAKVVCHYHGTAHARFPSCETRSGRTIGRLMMRAAHQVVVLGPTYERVMGDAWQRGIAWAPNTCDVELYRSVPRDARAPWRGEDERAVLFVGRLSEPKGFYDLLDAAPSVLERVPSARFVFVGVAESEELESVVRSAARKRGLADRVTFLGHLEGEEKLRAYASADLLAVPSWTEAFPLVIPEGMAAGLPIVASAVGAIPDFVDDGKDGFLVEPRDPRGLADRISSLLADDELRRRISDRVRERAPRDFAIEVGCGKVNAVLRGVLETAEPHEAATGSR